MKLITTKAATGQTVYVFIRDNTLTTGLGLTGLAYNSGSLVASYVRPLGSRTAITLATQTVTGAWSSGGFVEVDATNMPGVYRLDVPDAVFATGVDSAIVMLKGATNMEPVLIEFQLIAANLQDSVRAGLTALPNAAAAASGGLLISGTNSGTTTLGALTVTGATTFTGATTWTGALTASNASNNFRINGVVPGASGGLFIAGTNAATAVTTSFTTTFTGNLTGAVGSVTGAVGSVTGSVGSVASGGISEASFATTAGPFTPLGIVDQGTAQSATSTTLVLRAAAAFADDQLIGAQVLITGGSAGVGQVRTITDYVGSTDTATVDAWTTTPTGTITYKIFGSAPGPATPIPVDVKRVNGTTVTGNGGSGTEWGP